MEWCVTLGAVSFMSKWKFVFVAPPPPPRCCAGCGSGVDGRVVSRSDSRAGVCCCCVISRDGDGASGSVLGGVVVDEGVDGGDCCALRRVRGCGDSWAMAAGRERTQVRTIASVFMARDILLEMEAAAAAE